MAIEARKIEDIWSEEYTYRVNPPEPENATKYPAYFKPVSGMTHLDVYAVHMLFDVNDPSGCIQHASKKLLLSGVRTGGKSAYKDIKEARDTLNRYLELYKDASPDAR